MKYDKWVANRSPGLRAPLPTLESPIGSDSVISRSTRFSPEDLLAELRKRFLMRKPLARRRVFWILSNLDVEIYWQDLLRAAVSTSQWYVVRPPNF